jgi:hypothetical protein
VRSNLFINLLEHTKFTTDIASALGEQSRHAAAGVPVVVQALRAWAREDMLARLPFSSNGVAGGALKLQPCIGQVNHKSS